MRLRDTEVRAFVAALDPYLNGQAAELKLLGSRVSDLAKGGDIDLLLLTDEAHVAQEVRNNQHRILAAIYAEIGEQKIDLLVSQRQEAARDPFIATILPHALVLHVWT